MLLGCVFLVLPLFWDVRFSGRRPFWTILRLLAEGVAIGLARRVRLAGGATLGSVCASLVWALMYMVTVGVRVWMLPTSISGVFFTFSAFPE